MNIEVGTEVLVVDQNGNVCCEGTYHGVGIPSRDLKAKMPNIQHYAVQIKGEKQLHYYPVGFHTLMNSAIKPKR
jgi:hypothetical protein